MLRLLLERLGVRDSFWSATLLLDRAAGEASRGSATRFEALRLWAEAAVRLEASPAREDLEPYAERL